MIEFEIKPEYYKQIHNVICAISDECKLDFTNNDVSTKVVDPSNRCMVSMEINKNVFESYHINDDVSIGYVFDNFLMSNELKMLLNSDTNHKFNIYEKGKDIELQLIHGVFIDKFTLLDISSLRKQPKIPRLDLKCIFELESSFFKQIAKRYENVKFVVEDSKLICYGEPDWQTIPISVTTNESTKSLYSVDFLEEIANAIPDDIIITMTMGIDYPCTIEFNICDGQVPVKYLLAPRIESE